MEMKVEIVESDPQHSYCLYDFSMQNTSISKNDENRTAVDQTEKAQRVEKVRVQIGCGELDKASLCSCLHKANLLNSVSRTRKEADFIFLTTAFEFLGLPSLFKRIKGNPKVYATQLTIEFGRYLLYDYSRNLKDLPGLNDLSMATINECVAKVIPCNFGEEIKLRGEMVSWAISSGYCIGSCIWMVGGHTDSCLFEPFYAHVGLSSACGFRHPKELSVDWLRKSYCMGITQVNPNSANRGDSVMNLCAAVADTCKNGGNVLIPSFPFYGLSLDIIECVARYLKSNGLEDVKLIISSSQAKDVLNFLETVPESLCKDKQNRTFNGENAFTFRNLLGNNTLLIADHLGEILEKDVFNQKDIEKRLQHPVVVFTGCPCLRTGEARLLVESWKGEKNNAFLFMYSCYKPNDVLVPFGNVQAQVKWIPVDSRLNIDEITKIKKMDENIIWLNGGTTDLPSMDQLEGEFKPISFSSKKGNTLFETWPASIVDKVRKMKKKDQGMRCDCIRIVHENKQKPYILAFFKSLDTDLPLRQKKKRKKEPAKIQSTNNTNIVKPVHETVKIYLDCKGRITTECGNEALRVKVVDALDC